MPPSSSVNVQSFLHQHRFSRYQWLIFALTFLIVLLDGFDTAAIGYVAPSLVKEWDIARPALAPVLSAALYGLVCGAFAAGPLADRLGRKRVLVCSVAIFGLASLVASHASDITQLTLSRFATGVGLGAAMPNAVTLMSEYCPTQRRATLTNAMFCGFPLGAALGGFLAAWVIPLFGWRSVFLLGGVVPLVLVVIMVLMLPESVRYMVANSYPEARIKAALRRISRTVDSATVFVMSESSATPAGARGSAGVVLSRHYIVWTVMLWIAYFMGLVIFYAVINWMPVLFKDAGLGSGSATMISALFPLGGVGAVAFGWLMDRANGNKVVAIGFLLTAIGIYAIGKVGNAVGPLIVAVFVSGILMNTAQSSLPSLAADFYPTRGRATGVAWMMGVGRFGGIAGSYLVAEMSSRHFNFDQIFTVMAVPGLLAAVALAINKLLIETAGPFLLALIEASH